MNNQTKTFFLGMALLIIGALFWDSGSSEMLSKVLLGVGVYCFFLIPLNQNCNCGNTSDLGPTPACPIHDDIKGGAGEELTK